MNNEPSKPVSISTKLLLERENEDKFVRVVWNEKTTTRLYIIRDALVGLRQIVSADAVSSMHPHVIMLLDAGFGKLEYPDDHERIEKARRFIAQDCLQQSRRVLNDALEISVLESNFIIREGKPPTVRFADHPEIEISPEWWEAEEHNNSRALSMLPPLPRRLSFSPDEQKVALIARLKECYPFFAYRFVNIINTVSDEVVAMMLGEENETAAHDAAKSEGIQSGDDVESTDGGEHSRLSDVES